MSKKKNVDLILNNMLNQMTNVTLEYKVKTILLNLKKGI